MSPRRRLEQKKDDRRPVVADDYIYDDPDQSAGSVTESASDTPEEAIRKLKRRRAEESPSEAREEKEAESVSSDDQENTPAASVVHTSHGISLDENLMPVSTGKKVRRIHPFIRGFILVVVTLVLILSVSAYIVRRLPGVNVSFLSIPESVISSAVSPVQNFFSGMTETLFGYFRSMKLRSNLETAYNELRAENERLVYQAMRATELEKELSRYADLSDEIKANAEMRGIPGKIIGRSDSNYFSTLTINKGSEDGIETLMAVTFSGALVGYTESVEKKTSVVRTIIDSEASIAGVIQSSKRDQGMVRGTLGIDGTSKCRMYYLPNDTLPRPGDRVVTSGVGVPFPQGIPIGDIEESTRGMDANKKYIVLKPLVDFEHLEDVIVLRYKPKYAEPIEGRDNGMNIDFVPLETARPSPVIPLIANTLTDGTATQDPNITETPSPIPTDTPTPTPSPTPPPTPTPDQTSLVYQVVSFGHSDPTPTPTPSPQPTSTPYITPDPDEMNYEED